MNNSEIKSYELSLNNISKDLEVHNMKKTGFYGWVYNFSVDYDNIAITDITSIHKYLIKKTQYFINAWIL